MSKWTRRWLVLGLLVSAPLAAEIRSLTILHTNDLHARLTAPENRPGGFAFVAAAIQRERAHCTDCILLNAGDLVQGSPVSTIFHGLPVFEIANLFHFDAATLGNHEFDYGWPQVRTFINVANYPLVSANMVDADGRLFTAQPYVILKVNGLRVAVIGAMTDDLVNLTTPQLMGEWRAAPVFARVKKYAAEVRDRSDLIVLLAHITGAEEMHFLDDAPEIPVMVTGHLHVGMKRAMTRYGRILVRVKGFGEEIGRLELQVDTEKKAPVNWTWKQIPVDAKALQPEAEVAAQVEHWENEVKARVDQPLALTKRSFTKSQVRDLMERAMRDQTGADFAFVNLGGVRDTLPAGQLLVRNIWNIMPFDNRVVFGKFKGRDLPRAVVGEQHVDADREYTLAVTDFTAANQGAGEQLQSKGLVFAGDGGLLRDLLVDWFRKRKVIE
jgi:2',3'-cyclic-nucleotide 2'-phosphodiesterase (5'-nucleotidase family)